METYKIAVFNEIIRTHNQYGNDSFLWYKIQALWDISESKAKRLAKSYCNVLSFYAVLRAGEFINISLFEFMSDLKDQPFYNKKGKKTKKKLLCKDGFLRSKKQICKFYSFDISEVYFDCYGVVTDTSNLDDKYFYQMKINQRFKGYHFMGGYIKNGTLYISCSAKRGIAVPAKDVIKKRYLSGKKYFRWIRLIG